jgi:hypothetical protein
MFRINLAAAAVAAGLVLSLAGPATAALSPDAVRIETDDIALKDATNATFTGAGYVDLDRDYVQVAVGGQLVKGYSVPGCRAVRAIFTYAGGATSTVTSPRVCLELGTYRSTVSLRSDDSRQVVRYAVQLLSSTDSTSALVVKAGNTEFVGDAPDSFGNESRLDHDVHQAVMTKSGRTEVMFAGASDYFLQRHAVSISDFVWWSPRVRITGTLSWSDLIAGTEAYLSVRWTYADGSTSSVLSDKVSRNSVVSRQITLTSSSTKPVASVSMAVYSNYAGYGALTSGSTGRFGDGSTGQ